MKANKLKSIFAIVLLVILFAPNTLLATETLSTRTPPKVPLMLDPNINMYRVKAPLAMQQLTALEAQTSSITVNYLPTGADPYGIGDTCTTWPTEAKTAFSYAISIWQSKIRSSVPIVIDACWATNLPSGVLGHSGSLSFARDFTNAPSAGTWYPASLANSLAGSDLDADADMYIAYSNVFSWYYGTDGNTPSTQVDLVSVILHEIAHGLGFSGSMTVSGGIGSWGGGTIYPFIYDRFTQNGSAQSLLNTSLFPNSSTALGTQLTSNDLYFNGSNANTANGGTPPKIYAPATWSSGSSYSHLDEIYNNTPNALMTYSLSYGESVHDPGPITMGLFQDIGWQADTTPPTVTSTSPAAGAAGVAVSSTISATFSEDMDAATITSSTFTLDNGATGTVSYNAGTRTATFTSSTSLTANTVYTATISTGVKDLAGNAMSAAKTWSFTTINPLRTLSVAISGDGSGSVNSDPSGIACATGNSGTCSYQFDNGSSVTLMPSASGGSLFNGWTGTCSGVDGNNCVVTMDADKSFTAAFRMILPVLIEGGRDFDSLQAAFDSKVSSAFTVKAQDTELAGNLSAGGNNTVSLKGGYNSDFSSNIGGVTVMSGVLTLVNGSLTVENLVIK